MSLSLLQGYSSDEEDPGNTLQKEDSFSNLSDEEQEFARNHSEVEKSLILSQKSLRNSNLPSAFDAFSKVSGPPDFLNNCVAEYDSGKGKNEGNKIRKSKKDLPDGAVVEVKAQLIGIRDRVRSDVDGNYPTGAIESQKGLNTSANSENRRVVSVANPDAKDAAELLRMCMQCGVPKTYSHTRGMICPVCGDRPTEPDKDSSKKKGSTIKDKEKSKRMKGQSSHASWKSETEMQLRQQFD